MKICKKCDKALSEEFFHKNKRSVDGFAEWCADCTSSYKEEWHRKNAVAKQDSDRKAYLKSKFGISVEQYDNLLERQGGRCGVCQKPHSAFKRRLAVDHNHLSGEIRGLLCNFCNHRFIGRHRDSEMFVRAAQYLQEGTGWFVPKKKARPKRRKVLRNG